MMKKRVIILLGVLLMFTMLVGLLSCNNNDTDPEDTTVTADQNGPATPTKVRTPVDQYVIVLPEGLFTFATDTVSSVASSVQRKAGSTLPKEEEYTTEPTADRYEIIVGNTVRAESQAALAKLDYNQYGVFVSEYKIVIVGWTDYTTRLAAIKFNELLSKHVVT